jgi:hypothetical protein
VSAKLKRRNNKRALGKLWQPAVILAVLAIVGYGVHTIRGNNENISHPAARSTIPATVVPINPKNVTYEAFGTLGGGGKVVYANLDSQPIEVRLASLPPTYRDVEDFSNNDLILMMLATFGLVFVIVLVITRALVGSIIVLVIVILSFAGALGLAALIWETFLGIQLHWLNIPIAFIVLVGVGCDYNLLLLSRYREEIDAGVKTGMIRAVAGSLSVAVTAALVLAGTMLALLSSDVKNIGQAGSTTAIGLVFDMFIMRLCLVLPLARLLGPWFWWPQSVRSRPRTDISAASHSGG